jgi:predicted transcriptional regulator
MLPHIDSPADAGIPFGALAKLLGISRRTLYRWQEAHTA